MPFSENLYVCFLIWSEDIPTETSECGEDPWEGDDERQDCLSDAPHQGFQGGHVLPGHAVNAGHGGTWGERRGHVHCGGTLRGCPRARFPVSQTPSHQASSFDRFLGKSFHVTGYKLHSTIPQSPTKPNNRLLNSTAKHIFMVYAAYLTQGMFIKKKNESFITVIFQLGVDSVRSHQHF